MSETTTDIAIEIERIKNDAIYEMERAKALMLRDLSGIDKCTLGKLREILKRFSATETSIYAKINAFDLKIQQYLNGALNQEEFRAEMQEIRKIISELEGGEVVMATLEELEARIAQLETGTNENTITSLILTAEAIYGTTGTGFGFDDHLTKAFIMGDLFTIHYCISLNSSANIASNTELFKINLPENIELDFNDVHPEDTLNIAGDSVDISSAFGIYPIGNNTPKIYPSIYLNKNGVIYTASAINSITSGNYYHIKGFFACKIKDKEV